jgi:hypothetical protein
MMGPLPQSVGYCAADFGSRRDPLESASSMSDAVSGKRLASERVARVRFMAVCVSALRVEGELRTVLSNVLHDRADIDGCVPI